jgi:hypothetical protein
MNDQIKDFTRYTKRLAKHTVVSPLRLGNVDEIVITEL